MTYNISEKFFGAEGNKMFSPVVKSFLRRTKIRMVENGLYVKTKNPLLVSTMDP